ncbi:Mobile element protein (plasmid) [Candidatus Enterovibrio altilux]|uniref:Mobile element protein n=1 Tax=Candidatus Enterovibrio altilux TaxID=1927128 RepID=A0A291BAV1_9GAMM|nr:Mobile element protein [Candidatus Enterovibrio luxaltus]
MPCPYYSCISKRAKTVSVTFKTKNKAMILHLAMNNTMLFNYFCILIKNISR